MNWNDLRKVQTTKLRMRPVDNSVMEGYQEPVPQTEYVNTEPAFKGAGLPTVGIGDLEFGISDLAGTGLLSKAALATAALMGGIKSVGKKLSKDEFLAQSANKLSEAMNRHGVGTHEMVGAIGGRKQAAVEKIQDNIEQKLLTEYKVGNVRDASGNKEIEQVMADLETQARSLRNPKPIQSPEVVGPQAEAIAAATGTLAPDLLAEELRKPQP